MSTQKGIIYLIEMFDDCKSELEQLQQKQSQIHTRINDLHVQLKSTGNELSHRLRKLDSSVMYKGHVYISAPADSYGINVQKITHANVLLEGYAAEDVDRE